MRVLSYFSEGEKENGMADDDKSIKISQDLLENGILVAAEGMDRRFTASAVQYCRQQCIRNTVDSVVLKLSFSFYCYAYT